jgi:proline dehydrogenase
MSLFRSLLLSASQNAWMREHAPRYGFVRKTAARFLPGETLDEALGAARALRAEGIGSALTLLGENVSTIEEAEHEAATYVEILGRLREAGLAQEVSVKLTHLGLDLGADVCERNLRRIVERAGDGMVWIDMESSDYTQRSLEIFQRVRAASPRIAICLQAYLYRTAKDLEQLLPLGATIRLVKGAYREPAERAFPKKADVDRNFFALTERLLSEDARRAGTRAAIATHDLELIAKTIALAEARGIARQDYEFQMLYGIQRTEQVRLAKEGFRSSVLINYGAHWYAWFMRRMAERPANTWFAVKNIVSRG